MQTPVAKLYEFGDFQLDTGKRLLRRLDGTPVPLTSRVFDTLLYMVRHHDAVLGGSWRRSACRLGLEHDVVAERNWSRGAVSGRSDSLMMAM